MKLKITVLAMLFAMGATAQQEDPVVMTVNGNEIRRSELEYYYNRDSATQKDINDYALRFADRKLKMYAAIDAGLDTTSAARAEIDAYKGALAKSYLTDAAAEEQEARRRYSKLDSRLSQGYVRISRIFRRMPQNITSRTLERQERQMDSIYSVLQKSPLLFADFVMHFSDDKQTSDIEPLQTTEDYEKQVFAMKVGEISKPFYTPSGIQIVKVIARGDLPGYGDMAEELKGRLTHRTTSSVVERLKRECSFSENSKAVTALLAGTDTDEQLFTVAERSYTGADFRRFAATYPRQRSTQYEAYVMKCLMDYESSHIEELHPEHEMKIREHTETLLAEVFDRSRQLSPQEYRSGLEEYFQEHRSDYRWEPFKYRGVAVRCADDATAKRIKKELKKLPYEQWPDTIAARYTVDGKARAKAEYGLFSQGDNDVVDFIVFGATTVNTSGDYPRAFVVGRKQKRAESVEEAGEALPAAYDNHLKEQSMKRLRQSGQVEINQDVLKTLNNH
jgi:peptidyl-prolyl cis-trans isomerase SurA